MQGILTMSVVSGAHPAVIVTVSVLVLYLVTVLYEPWSPKH